MDPHPTDDPVWHAVHDLTPLFEALEAVCEGAPADARQLDEVTAAFDEAWERVRHRLSVDLNQPPMH